jgi:subtilase family serine protease
MLSAGSPREKGFMRYQKFAPLVVVAFLLSLNSSVFAQSKARDRVVTSIDDSHVAMLKGDVHPRARTEFDRGRVAPAMTMNHMLLALKPSPEQQASLDRLLADQTNPKSARFHQWLTPEQFADQFGASQNDFDKAVTWLQTRGFTVADKARSRTWIAFDGTAAQAASVFRTQIHQYEVNGKLQYANATEPAVPAALATIVGGVRLHNFKPRAHSAARKLKPNFTSDQSGNHFLAPEDFATIYNLQGLYTAGIDGTGEKIAVMGQTDIVMSNVTRFRSLSGLPALTPTVILNGPDPGVISGDDVEAYLDIEWAGAVARNAQIIYVNSGGTASGAFDALKYSIDNLTAPVISISYGDCEPNFTPSDINIIQGWLQQANSQGQTVVGPSGDDGAADCDYPLNANQTVISATHGLAVDIPASFPYVTAVGGTTFNEGTGTYWNTTNTASGGSAKSYIPEVVWNDTVADIADGSNSFAATGGGKSTLFTKPTWQTGLGVPADNVRFVPDISFAASVDHDGYLTCMPGYCVSPNGFRDAQNNLLGVVGGTSAGVPVFAGIVALINQQTGGSQGNLNPTLYSLAASTPSIFHDITSGDNKVPCTAPSKDCPAGTTSIGYTAGVGYDMTTGLGTIDASALVNSFPASSGKPDVQIAKQSTSLTITHGNTVTDTLSFNGVNGFTGTLNLTCSVSPGLGSTTCSVPATVTVNPTGTADLTIHAASQLAGLRTSEPIFGWKMGSGLTLFAGIFLITGKQSRKRLSWLTVLTVISLTTLMLACGGGGSGGGGGGGGTPLSGTITVNATNGTVTKATTINVTVN